MTTKSHNGGDFGAWTLALDNGTTCDVIKTVKNLQRNKNSRKMICPTSKIKAERNYTLNGDGSFNQFYSNLEYSKYLDAFRKHFGELNYFNSSNENKKLIEAAKEYNLYVDAFSGFVNKKAASFQNQCKTIDLEAINTYLAPLTWEALEDETCFSESPGNKNCRFSHAIIGKNKKIKKNSVYVDGVNKELIKLISKKITSRSEQSFESILIKSVDEITKHDSRSREKIRKIVDQASFKESISKISAEYMDYKKDGLLQKCIDQKINDYVKSEEYLDNIAIDEKMCSFSRLASTVPGFLEKLPTDDLLSIEEILDRALYAPVKEFDETMLSLWGSDCGNEDKISVPDSLSCHKTIISYKNKSASNKIIISNLMKDSALTGSFCSAIFSKAKKDFQPGECGNHSVGIIGAKCESGKLKYLVQNSWGAGFYAKNKDINVESGKGLAWLDEKTFYDSFYNLEHVNK